MLTMVFTDLVNSTPVKASLTGIDLSERNHAYYKTILNPHRERILSIRERHQGRLVDQIGDSFFLVFESVAAAAHFAINLQRSHAEDPIVSPLGRVQVRVGMHTGEPLPDPDGSGRLIGQEIDYAARLCSLAEGDQIILSDATASLLRNAMLEETSSHSHGERLLKGIGRVPIFELIFGGKAPAPIRESALASENLPPMPHRINGRDELIGELRERLHAGETVILKGEGGMGKTTLALAVAHGMNRSGEAPGGSCWINCETQPDLKEILHLTADVFFRDRNDTESAEALTKRIGSHMRQKTPLLILDNFESVAHDQALIRWLSTQRLPSRVLITTREVPPGLTGRVIPVQELARRDSTRLFRERSAEAGVIELPPESLVNALCELVGDQPLAVELLAARAARTPVPRLLEQLRKGLTVLDAKGDPTRPDRHQSAKACIRGSFADLNESARDLLVACSVFSAPFGSELITAVVGHDDWDDDASQLVSTSIWRLSGLRYGTHALVRQFASEQIVDRSAVEAKAMNAVLTVLRNHWSVMRFGPQYLETSTRYLNWCRENISNIVTAVEIARTRGEWGIIPEIAKMTEDFWNTCGNWPVAEKIGEAVLVSAEQLNDPRIAAFGHDYLGFVYRHQRQYKKAVDSHQKCIAVIEAHAEASDPTLLAQCHARLGKTLTNMGEINLAASELDTAVKKFRALGDIEGEVMSQVYQGQNSKFLCEYHKSEAIFKEALNAARARGFVAMEKEILYQLGDCQLKIGSYSEAAGHLLKSAKLSRQFGNLEAEAKALSDLGMATYLQGDLVAARDYLNRALEVHIETGFRNREGRALRRLGQVGLAAGNRDEAIEYAKKAVAVLREINSVFGIVRAEKFLNCLIDGSTFDL